MCRCLLVYVADIFHDSLVFADWTLGGNDFVQTSHHVYVLRPPAPGVTSGVPAVAKVDQQESRDANIGSQEVRSIESLREECVESVDKDQEDEAEDTNTSSPRLEPGPVREFDALDLDGFGEAEVDDAAAGPTDERGRVGETDEPVEDARAAAADSQIGEREEESTSCQRHVRQTVAVAGPEDVRSVTSHSE